MSKPIYRRVLLKLSGEALAPASKEDGILDFKFIDRVAEVLKKCQAEGVQIAITVGAGNIWRGKQANPRMERVRADNMGMLATTINAIALKDSFVNAGLDAVVMTTVEMEMFADYYIPRKAIENLESGKIVIFGCGLGVPYFSTDTPAVLRAAEIHADAVLMAKNVDYLYDSDPRKNPDAKPFYDITYTEILDRDLKAFDLTAVSFCRENNIETYGFALADPENIYKAIMGEHVGTRMHS